MKSSLILIPKSTLNEKKRKVICFKKKISQTSCFSPFIIIVFMKKSKRDYPMGVYPMYCIYVRLSFFSAPLSSIILS